MDPIDTIKKMTRGLGYPRDPSARQQLTSAYYELTLDQGKDLADYAVHLEDRDTCSVILLNLALLVPGSLAHIHRQLLNPKYELFEWPTLFFQADPTISEELAGRFSDDLDIQEKHYLVEALAWTGNEVAQRILFEKAEEKLYFSADHWVAFQDIIPVAGWELTSAGRRRDLFFHDSYRLEFVEGQTTGCLLDRCPFCNRRLFAPFQFPLSDPRLSFLDLPGEEICIGTCLNCVQEVPIYMRIDHSGRSIWSSKNIRPRFMERSSDVEEVLMRGQMRIGDRGKSPYELAAWLPHNPNQLGGFPGWVQWPDYPICISCHNRMKFLAQVDIYGVYYAFICPDCGIAATSSQSD